MKIDKKQLTILVENKNGLNVNAFSSEKEFNLPDEIINSNGYKKGLEVVRRRIENGLAFNGIRQSPFDVNIMNGEIAIFCNAISYEQSFAVSSAIAEMQDNELTKTIPIFGAYPGASCGLDVCIISADNKVILNKRSEKVGKWPNSWSIGFGEGLEESDLGTDSFFNAAIRCIQEEIGFYFNDHVSLKKCFKIISLAQETRSLTLNSYCIFDFRILKDSIFDADFITEKFSSAHDAWESISVISMDVKLLSEFLRDKETTPGSQVFLNYFSKNK